MKNKTTREDLEKEFMKMPVLEKEQESPIIKRMNDINTFQEHDGELCLRGTDEMGDCFTVWFDTYDFLNWIDTEQLKYIKKQLIKHIKTK